MNQRSTRSSSSQCGRRARSGRPKPGPAPSFSSGRVRPAAAPVVPVFGPLATTLPPHAAFGDLRGHWGEIGQILMGTGKLECGGLPRRQRSSSVPMMWSLRNACVRAYCSVRSDRSLAAPVLRSAPRTVPLRMPASSARRIIAASRLDQRETALFHGVARGTISVVRLSCASCRTRLWSGSTMTTRAFRRFRLEWRTHRIFRVFGRFGRNGQRPRKPSVRRRTGFRSVVECFRYRPSPASPAQPSLPACTRSTVTRSARLWRTPARAQIGHSAAITMATITSSSVKPR